MSKKIIEKNSLLVTCIGSDMGKVVINAVPVVANQQINAIIPYNEVVTSDFLYYRLIDIYEVLKRHGGDGTAVPILNKNDFSLIETEFPPLQEQKAIAEVLSSLDDKIDLLHRQNKTLEALAETLFRQWFVEGASEDWEHGVLGSLVEFHYGKGLKKSIRSGHGYPVIGSSGIVGYHSEFIVDGPGIVIGRKGTLGKTIYIAENFYPIDTTYFVKPKNNIGYSFIYYLLNSIDFKEMNSDSAVPGLNRDIALGVEIKLSPIEMIHEFENITGPVFTKINNNKLQISSLEKLRDILLPKLMSGEIQVKCEGLFDGKETA